MSVITYQNIPVIASSPRGNFYYAAATNATISAQNRLEASRILAPNQNNNYRIGGELNSKISITFAAVNKSKGSDTWNFASGVLNDLTGQSGTNIIIGGNTFSGCYLESVSLDIAPFSPVMVSADFTCLNPPTGTAFSGSGVGFTDNLTDSIAYGFYTVITNGTTFSDANRESISYKINCDRSYTTSIGRTSPNNAFLNGVEKELNIKCHNIGAYINYSGYGGIINIDPKNISGQSIVSGGFGMSANCKLVSQNISVQEGDVLMADISLREVVL